MDYKEIVKNKRTRRKLIATSAVLSLSSVPIIVLAMLEDNLVFLIVGFGLLAAAVGIYFFFAYCLAMYVRGKRKEFIEEGQKEQRQISEQPDDEMDRPLFAVGQKLLFTASNSIMFVGFGIFFACMSWYALTSMEASSLTSFFAAGNVLVAVTIFLFVLAVPYGRADVYEDRIQLFSIRLFGLVKKEAGTIVFEDVTSVGCWRTPVTIGVKQIVIVIQLPRWRESFDSTYSIEDRKRLASIFRQKSSEHGFEFLDEDGLLG